MSGHTPGPWHVSEFGQSTKENQADYTRIHFGPRTGQFEAVFLTAHPVSSISEVEANAKLAATAPDLLEALIAIEAAYSQLTNWEYAGSTDRNPQLTSPVAIAARKAIARAKGEA